MKVTFWGTRGSIATSGPETTAFGGDTACVAVSGPDPAHLVILDAGTGIRRLGAEIDRRVRRIDLLLSHLHLDHIVGIGFFEPLFRPDVTVSVWAPPSTTPLIERFGRYLSPPLFPVRLRDLACELELRDASEEPVVRGTFTITAVPIIHPDNAVGYRLECGGSSMAYLPDHEPALGPSFPFESSMDVRGRVGRRGGPAHPRRAVHAGGVRRSHRLGAFVDPPGGGLRGADGRQGPRPLPPRPLAR